jgi:hypothetical protein
MWWVHPILLVALLLYGQLIRSLVSAEKRLYYFNPARTGVRLPTIMFFFFFIEF